MNYDGGINSNNYFCWKFKIKTIPVGVLKRIDSSNPYLQTTVSKLRKTFGFTRRIFFSGFYSLETFVLNRAKTFETVWEILIYMSRWKRLKKKKILIFGKFICCYYQRCYPANEQLAHIRRCGVSVSSWEHAIPTSRYTRHFCIQIKNNYHNPVN